MGKNGGERSGNRKRHASVAERRSLFVREYLIDRNGTKAAIRAGFAPKSAHVTASRLLKDPKIAAEIEAVTAKVFGRLEVTKERLTRELAKIAFSDVRDYLTWGPDEKAVIDPQTGAVVGKTSGVSLKPSSEIKDDAAGVISEISETQTGLKVKLHDKPTAIKMLGQELGMFREKVEHDFASPLAVLVEAIQREASPLPVQDPNAGRVHRREDTADHQPSASSPKAAAAPTISPLLRRQGA